MRLWGIVDVPETDTVGGGIVAKAARKLDNWIFGYQQYCEGTESPPTFHLWTAVGTLAAAMQRKIFMDAGYYQIHSNMYIILVSPPGRSRKSTALRIGKSLLKGAMDYGVELNFSTQASSVAGLVKQLETIKEKDHQSLTSFSSELGSLLGNKSIEMVDFLVDIYDCNPDWDKQTVSRGLEKIERPWFNMLAATTPQWMGDNLSKTAVEGGFVSRSIFVYDDTRLLVAFPELTPEQKELKKKLSHDLAQIAQLRGLFTFGPGAREFYKEWYEDKGRITADVDYRISGYYERKHIHVLKVAMALSIAESNELKLTRTHIESALALLASIEPGMHRAFSSVGKNVFSADLERIRDQVVKSPKGMTLRQIINANIHAADKETLEKLLGTLVDMGEIELVDPKNRLFKATSHANGNGKKA